MFVLSLHVNGKPQADPVDADLLERPLEAIREATRPERTNDLLGEYLWQARLRLGNDGSHDDGADFSAMDEAIAKETKDPPLSPRATMVSASIDLVSEIQAPS